MDYYYHCFTLENLGIEMRLEWDLGMEFLNSSSLRLFTDRK